MERASAEMVGLLLVAMVAGTMMLAVAGEAEKKSDEQRVAWKDVPAVVQATVTSNANGGVVLDVEKETEKGRVVYSAEVKGKDGKVVEIEVAEDGKLIKIEVDDDDDKDEVGEAPGKGEHGKKEHEAEEDEKDEK